MKTTAAVLCELGGKWEVGEDLTLYEKQVRGALFGSSNRHHDIPRLLEMHNLGQLQLAELITREYALEDINSGYDDMREGRNIRGVIRF